MACLNRMLLLLILGAGLLAPVDSKAQMVRAIFFVADTSRQAARMGTELGFEEARRAAQMLGFDLEVILEPHYDPDDAVWALQTIAEEKTLTAAIGGYDEQTCRLLLRATEELGMLYLNVGCPEDVFRGEACAAHAFHILPSQAMTEDARRMAEDDAGEIVAWDGSLFRYGAAQLNQRFDHAFGKSMDGDAWVAWMAVKVLVEGALRTRSTEPDSIARFLGSTRARFDGHKGQPLTFRPWDHQLRQPLYVIRSRREGTEVVGELPEPVAGDTAHHTALDVYGTPEDASTCRLTGRADARGGSGDADSTN